MYTNSSKHQRLFTTRGPLHQVFRRQKEGHYRLACLFLDVLSKDYLRAFRVKRFGVSTSSASFGKEIFCGRQDGSVAVYNTHSGLEDTYLYRHATNISVNKIVWGGSASILATADEPGGIIIQNLTRCSEKWLLSHTIFDYPFSNAVTGLLFNPGNIILLITTATSRPICYGYAEKKSFETSTCSTWLLGHVYRLPLLNYH
ncbi:f16c551e-cca6-47af-8de5-a1fac448f51a [Sclerotinia trifoliorum]|uniref:F16c551e-cca6-47af-8de5-a1fac448f51a n=1 Tax=Sclerotinia trifoliorum TaxID=28548 RepID=A0A8H2VPI4_9HELO|nr:f16c551e-cca6-47af-8de5-a1fac448f51a [Sclerotinia trifoliorum]